MAGTWAKIDHRQEHAVGAFDARAADFRRTGHHGRRENACGPWSCSTCSDASGTVVADNEKRSWKGHSVVPLLKNADAPREWPAITTANHDNHAVRTERWRYIRYADGSEELYDEQSDPNEWTNLASDKTFDAIKHELLNWMPKTSKSPCRQRATHTDVRPRTGRINWEGKTSVKTIRSRSKSVSTLLSPDVL